MRAPKITECADDDVSSRILGDGKMMKFTGADRREKIRATKQEEK